MDITQYSLEFQREPLLAPFGFKGGYVSDLWHSRVTLTGRSGITRDGFGVQSVLWSDPEIFASHSPAGGNALMLLITEYCARRMCSASSDHPLALFDSLYPEVLEYARHVTGHPALRPTFALNAMVAADNAAWQLYAAEQGIKSFDALVPPSCAAPFTARHEALAAIPLIPYGTALDEVRALADSGYFVFKIKIGSDPDRDGDPAKMLAWDKARLLELHAVLSRYHTDYTDTGRLAYYLDANGRYASMEALLPLLDYADQIGALEHILLLEEPFPENSGLDVSALPVTVAADESAHSDKDAQALMALGYGAIALKPIAKTLSMSLRIAEAAARRGIPCFCADLTVSPLLVDINKCFAARLAPIPGMKIGILESNGKQNYLHWDRMLSEHPMPGGDWIAVKNGLFRLSEDFYRHSGGVFAAERSEL